MAITFVYPDLEADIQGFEAVVKKQAAEAVDVCSCALPQRIHAGDFATPYRSKIPPHAFAGPRSRVLRTTVAVPYCYVTNAPAALVWRKLGQRMEAHWLCQSCLERKSDRLIGIWYGVPT